MIKNKWFILALALLPGLTFADVLRGNVYLKNANLRADTDSVGNLTNSFFADRTREVMLPLSSFVLETSGIPLAAATEPGSVKANNVPAAEWAQGETAKIATHFVVPSDYSSGLAFNCFVSLDASSSDTTVDFELFINDADTAYDAAAVGQDPVAVADNTANMQEIKLTPATDTVSIGDLVTLNVWRAAGTGAGSNLNLYACKFVYTADM